MHILKINITVNVNKAINEEYNTFGGGGVVLGEVWQSAFDGV